MIYQRKNLTNIPSQQFYISWCFYFLDIWHFWPNGSSSQKVRVGFIIFLTFRRWRWISWRFMTRKKWRIQLLEAVVKVERKNSFLSQLVLRFIICWISWRFMTRKKWRIQLLEAVDKVEQKNFFKPVGPWLLNLCFGSRKIIEDLGRFMAIELCLSLQIYRFCS